MIRQPYKFALLPNIKFGITKLLQNIDHNWNTKLWAALTLKRTTISLKTKNIGLKKKVIQTSISTTGLQTGAGPWKVRSKLYFSRLNTFIKFYSCRKTKDRFCNTIFIHMPNCQWVKFCYSNYVSTRKYFVQNSQVFKTFYLKIIFRTKAENCKLFPKNIRNNKPIKKNRYIYRKWIKPPTTSL